MVSAPFTAINTWRRQIMKDVDVHEEMNKIFELTDYKQQVHKTLELLKRIFDNRDDHYGDFRDNFEQMARSQSIFFNRNVTAKDIVSKYMITKLVRISQKENNKADNNLDLAIYAILHLLLDAPRKQGISKAFTKWAKTGIYEIN